MLFEPVHGLLDIRKDRALVLFCQFNEDLEIVPQRRDLLPGGKDVGDVRFFRLQVPCLGLVFPDIRVCKQRVEFR